MKRQININKAAILVALCASILSGALISTNSYAIDYSDISNWAENTGFNDLSLFNCVLWEYANANTVGIDDIYDEIGPNGALPQAGMDKITELPCSYYYIADTTGLEKLPNLEYLSLGNNRISSIDLSKNTKLIELYLGNNRLTSIDLSKNTELTKLSLEGNRLTSIDLSANRKLISVLLTSNLLSEANLYYNTNLMALDIARNNLTELDLSNSPFLTAIGADDITLTTSARAKKSDGTTYSLHLPMPYYIFTHIPDDEAPSQSYAESYDSFSSQGLEGASASDTRRTSSSIPRWQPANSLNYSYDLGSNNYVFESRDKVATEIGIEYPDSTITINPRPISIVPSVNVDGTTYELSDTSILPTKYIGEAWDSNDYREIADRLLVENGKENVKLVKVEIYNSLKNAPGVETGLDSKSTKLHLLGTIPDIEVPIVNVIDAESESEPEPDPDQGGSQTIPVISRENNSKSGSSDSRGSSIDDYTYNPDVILAPGTPDFRIVYYFETVEPSIAVPDTGFSARWEGSETTSVTPIATIIAFVSLAVASVLHIIKCQAHKVRFKKY